MATESIQGVSGPPWRAGTHDESGAPGKYVWSRLGSNQRPSACEADALPLSHGTGAERQRGRRLARSVPAPNVLPRPVIAKAPQRTWRFVCAGSRGLSSCFAPGDDLVRCARM